MRCWECEIEGVPLHNHHPVPRSRGGTKTIPLCEPCHSKAHHRKKNMNTSKLTKEGLARARARGVKLGGPKIKTIGIIGREVSRRRANQFARDMIPLVEECKANGIKTFLGIANYFNEKGIETSRGRGAQWYAKTVKDLLNRIELIGGS